MGVLGELGWNMQIIYDLSGRVPKLFRPPQGDVDDRVRAIAKEVFGLTTVMWTADCNDWCLEASGGSTCPGEVPGEDRASVKSAIDAALKRPKSPGVSILEHELNHVTIELFTQYYPTLNASGWKPQAVSDQFGLNWYANAVDNDDIPINVTSMVAATTLAEVQQNNQSSTNATLYGNNNNNNNNTNTSNMSGLASNNTNPPTSPNSSSSSLQWTHPPVFTLALLVVVALVCT
jgi:chitin deacetylase